MRSQGVLRSSVHGLVPWSSGSPGGMMGIQDDAVLTLGTLGEVLSGADLDSAMRALAKGVGRGMPVTSPRDYPDLWRAFAATAQPEPPIVPVTTPLTPANPCPDGYYRALRTKCADNAFDFQTYLGRHLQRQWCRGRKSSLRPLSEIAAQSVQDLTDLAGFCATPLAQTHIERLMNLVENFLGQQANHVACVVMEACFRWSPEAVESLLCEAYDAGIKLSTLRLHQLLDYAELHPEVELLPVEFRLLMAF